jgi:putative hydrolase of the HAD superfamily
VNTEGLVIFDAFNTLVTARPGSTTTFLDGLTSAGLDASPALLAKLQAASEGLDHSAWSACRQSYVEWANATLRTVREVGVSAGSDLGGWVVPALEQLHQSLMVTMAGASSCLRMLKAAGFTIAVCSNWGWDLREDLESTGLTAYVDVLVTSAHAGYRKPHPRIYGSTLEAAGFAADEAVFVGDSLRTDVLGPEKAGIRSVLLAPAARETFHREQVRSLAAVARLLIDGNPAGEPRR